MTEKKTTMSEAEARMLEMADKCVEASKEAVKAWREALGVEEPKVAPRPASGVWTWNKPDCSDAEYRRDKAAEDLYDGIKAGDFD